MVKLTFKYLKLKKNGQKIIENYALQLATALA